MTPAAEVPAGSPHLESPMWLDQSKGQWVATCVPQPIVKPSSTCRDTPGSSSGKCLRLLVQATFVRTPSIGLWVTNLIRRADSWTCPAGLGSVQDGRELSRWCKRGVQNYLIVRWRAGCRPDETNEETALTTMQLLIGG